MAVRAERHAQDSGLVARELAQDGAVQRLRFVVSRDGGVTSGPNFWAGNSTLSLTTNRDYYAAMVFNAGTVKFYLVDLTAADPVVQTETLSTTALAFYDAATDFRLGAFQNTGGVASFPGQMDEVRVSRMALPLDSLLVSRTVSRLSTIAKVGGDIVITGTGAPGASYVGQRSTDMIGWSDIAPNLAADSSGHLDFTDKATSVSTGFYRLREP